MANPRKHAALTFEIIEYHSKETKRDAQKRKIGEHTVVRHIASINGMPFYRSSGENSGHPGTWFPFRGIYEGHNLEDSGKYFVFGQKAGYFIKPVIDQIRDVVKLPAEVEMKFDQLFGNALHEKNELRDRFYNLPNMLISSAIGGGFWDTDKGREMKNFLSLQYKEFYQNWSSISLSKPVAVFDDSQIANVNAWLVNKAGMDNLLSVFNQRCPQDVESLMNPVGLFGEAVVQASIVQDKPQPVVAQENRAVHAREILNAMIKEKIETPTATPKPGLKKDANYAGLKEIIERDIKKEGVTEQIKGLSAKYGAFKIDKRPDPAGQEAQIDKKGINKKGKF